MGQRSLLWRGHRDRQQTLAPQGGFQPHVVLWLTDDQGWANVGYHNQHFFTPNMDRLAKEGVTLERHYTFPWCAPSRASLMTGRMPHRGFQEAGQRVPQDVRMLSQLMRDSGYSTHHIGKWHLGLTRSWQYPTSRGFDTSLGFMGGGVDYVSSRISDHALGDDWSCPGIDLQQNGGPATGRNDVFSGTWISAEIDWAVYNRTRSKPMFLYVALQAMHSPTPGVEVLRPFMTHYKDQHEGPRFAASAALISHADELLGRLMRSLWSAGMWDSSLVIHLSDNGGQVNWVEDEVQGNNWPLRGMKRSLFEGGVRVPAFVGGGALPLSARGRVLDGYVHLADWFATLKVMAGSSEDVPEGSLSMASYIMGAVDESPRKEIVLAAGDSGSTVNFVEAVIQGPWKLINGSTPCGWDTWQGAHFPNRSSSATPGFMQPGCNTAAKTLLFDLETDPHEANNLADSPEDVHRQRLTELFELLSRARSEASPFEMDHDRAFDPELRLRWCETAREARGGFLGPYMEGRPATRDEYEAQLRLYPQLRRRPTVTDDLLRPINTDAARSVYTDDWRG